MSSNMAEQPLGSSKLPALLGAALVSKLNFRHVKFSRLALIGASATHMYFQARSVGARNSHFSQVANIVRYMLTCQMFMAHLAV